MPFVIIFVPKIKLMDMTERIKLLVNMFGGTQTEFANRIGTSPSTIASWISRNSIPTAALQRIKETCEKVDINWLLTGEGTILKEPISPTTISQWAVKLNGFTPYVQYTKGKKNVTIQAH